MRKDVPQGLTANALANKVANVQPILIDPRILRRLAADLGIDTVRDLAARSEVSEWVLYKAMSNGRIVPSAAMALELFLGRDDFKRGLDDRPVVVYRAFGVHPDGLLYVGVTRDYPARQDAHRKGSPWFWRVVRWEIEPHPTWEDGLAAELAAIKTENPRYNVKGKS